METKNKEINFHENLSTTHFANCNDELVIRMFTILKPHDANKNTFKLKSKAYKYYILPLPSIWLWIKILYIILLCFINVHKIMMMMMLSIYDAIIKLSV